MLLPYLETECEASSPAIICSNNISISYSELSIASEKWTKNLQSDRKRLIFHYIDDSPNAVISLLGALRSEHAIALLDPKLDKSARANLNEKYQPWAVIEASQRDDNEIVINFSNNQEDSDCSEIHPELSVLLSTSGSTGSPKFVRLSKKAITSNAVDIASVLEIKPKDIGLVHLDLHYSYGLSVLTSHWASGAAIGLSNGKFTDRGFWSGIRYLGATHLAGVPFHYEMIARLGPDRLKIPSVSTMTQAGGRLSDKYQTEMYDYMESVSGRFYVMYGQTEAAPRMATLSHQDFPEKRGSVGRAIGQGCFTILGDDGKPCQNSMDGEVIYKGSNVMMGYANTASDLSLGDENNSILHTGDRGYLDEDGFLFITGRASRLGKVFGWRVNLDEIEKFSSKFGESASIQIGEFIYIALVDSPYERKQELFEELSKAFVLPTRVFKYYPLDMLPRTDRNKVDYIALEQMITDAG